MRGLLALIVVGFLVLLVGSCTSFSSVEPGHVGIKVNRFGSSAGVSNETLGVGWYFTPPGTSIIEYPVSTQNYTWTYEKTEDKEVNEQFQFQDKNGLGLTANVGINYHINAAHASTLYQKFRMPMESIVSGPLRNVVRNALVTEASNMGVEEIYGPRKAELMSHVLKDVQDYFRPMGLEVEQLFWAGNIGVPEQVLAQINAKIANEQAALAAQANVAKAEAEARSKVAEAEGKAKATEIEAAAIRTNPEILKQRAIERWSGNLPQYMGGNTPLPFLSVN